MSNLETGVGVEDVLPYELLEQYLRSAQVLHLYRFTVEATGVPQVGGGGRAYVAVLLGGIGAIAKFSDEPDVSEAEARIGREVAAWEIARRLGFADLLATTVARRMISPRGIEVRASLQASWPYFDADAPFTAAREQDVLRAAVFDWVIGNTDRGGHNWVMLRGTAPSALKLIDHGHAFACAEAVSSSFYDLKHGTALSDPLREALAGLLRDWPPAVLTELLSAAEIEWVQRRGNALLSRNTL